MAPRLIARSFASLVEWGAPVQAGDRSATRRDTVPGTIKRPCSYHSSRVNGADARRTIGEAGVRGRLAQLVRALP